MHRDGTSSGGRLHRYCGRECQVAHWPDHERACKRSSRICPWSKMPTYPAREWMECDRIDEPDRVLHRRERTIGWLQPLCASFAPSLVIHGSMHARYDQELKKNELRHETMLPCATGTSLYRLYYCPKLPPEASRLQHASSCMCLSNRVRSVVVCAVLFLAIPFVSDLTLAAARRSHPRFFFPLVSRQKTEESGDMNLIRISLIAALTCTCGAQCKCMLTLRE